MGENLKLLKALVLYPILITGSIITTITFVALFMQAIIDLNVFVILITLIVGYISVIFNLQMFFYWKGILIEYGYMGKEERD